MNTPEEDKQKNKLSKWDRKNATGFKFTGWDKQGVPKWTGSWTKGAPRWFIIGFMISALTMLTAGIVVSLFATIKMAAPVLFFVGIVHSLVAGLMWRQRNNLQKLIPVEEVRERLGVDAQTMQRIAEEKKIKPRTIINDEPMYDLQDFGDVGTLLRAASAPVEPDTLLRAASASPVTPQEELLRAANQNNAANTDSTQANEEDFQPFGAAHDENGKP